jgi:hypothetical protein
MITEDLIDRLSSEAGRRLGQKARIGRVRALALLTEARVLVTRDGAGTWEEVFDGPPTLGELIARIGPRAYVIRLVTHARRARRGGADQGVLRRLAAE